jgi:hypothetical protein
MEKKINLPSSFIQFDTEEDDIIILRIPDEEKTQDENPKQPKDESEEKKEPQEEPENVENPFEEEKNNENKDQQSEDQESKNQESENQEGEDQKGEDQKGEDQKGQYQEGEDNKSQKGENEEEQIENEDGDFGNTSNEKIDLDDLLKNIKDEFEKGNSPQEIQNKMDIEIIEKALSTPRNNIKQVFKTKQIAKAAIGKTNLFGAENEQKINDVLNEIFK